MSVKGEKKIATYCATSFGDTKSVLHLHGKCRELFRYTLDLDWSGTVLYPD